MTRRNRWWLGSAAALVLAATGLSQVWAGPSPDPFRPLAESDVHAYIAYTPSIVRELRRSLAAAPPRCLPLDRLEAAATSAQYPGDYAEVSFLVWSAYEAVRSDRTGTSDDRARFAAVPVTDRALVEHHLSEVGVLVSMLQETLADLRCQQA